MACARRQACSVALCTCVVECVHMYMYANACTCAHMHASQLCTWSFRVVCCVCMCAHMCMCTVAQCVRASECHGCVCASVRHGSMHVHGVARAVRASTCHGSLHVHVEATAIHGCVCTRVSGPCVQPPRREQACVRAVGAVARGCLDRAVHGITCSPSADAAACSLLLPGIRGGFP